MKGATGESREDPGWGAGTPASLFLPPGPPKCSGRGCAEEDSQSKSGSSVGSSGRGQDIQEKPKLAVPCKSSSSFPTLGLLLREPAGVGPDGLSGPFKLPGCVPGFPTPSPPGPPRRQTAPELQISLELLTEVACVCVEGPGADFASHRPHTQHACSGGL